MSVLWYKMRISNLQRDSRLSKFVVQNMARSGLDNSNITGNAAHATGIGEDDLRKSEANYRLIFQKSALGQLICTQKDLHIIKVNEAALELYGYNEDEFLNLDIRQLRLPA